MESHKKCPHNHRGLQVPYSARWEQEGLVSKTARNSNDLQAQGVLGTTWLASDARVPAQPL